MFHTSDNLYFGRLPNGSVRVIKFRSRPQEWPQATHYYNPLSLHFDFTVSDTTWASVVAEVSLRGEIDGRYYRALAFHNNPQEPKPDSTPSTGFYTSETP